MNNPPSSRRTFLKASALAGLGLALDARSGSAAVEALDRPVSQKPVHQLTTPPRERVRVAVIGLHRGLEHVRCASALEFAQVVAVCDILDERAQAAAAACLQAGKPRPAIYSGSDSVWERMVERDDVDAVYIATPWNWHAPMALRAMDRGKHAFIEVPAAFTLEDCWSLVNASERTQRHCAILENCCYGEEELFVLNLARQGVFGEMVHAEGGYLHNLLSPRAPVLFQLDGEGAWRRGYRMRVDGNTYPTHGLGPVAQRLGVGRGDQLASLVSMSSREATLTRYRDRMRPNGGRHAAEKYVAGDMNTTIIRTEMGRTILVQLDVVFPRPYSRINALYGTDAVYFDYPPRLSLDNPRLYGLETKDSDEWLSEGDLAAMRERFTHPLWKKLKARASGAGHGGMDFIQSWRILDCLRRGTTPDITVYDAAAWSSIVELSTRSVAAGGAPMAIPDFTRGLWRTLQPLPAVDPADA